MVHQNSLTAYKTQVLPKLKASHQKIIDILSNHPQGLTSLEMADMMNKPLNSLSGRFTELSQSKDYGRPIIKEIGKKKNRYNNTCAIWQIIEPQETEQPTLFQ